MRLIDYIERERLSYDEIAKQLGITKTSVYRIVSGMHFPKAAIARDICDLTGGEVTLEDIYADRKNRKICPHCGHKLSRDEDQERSTSARIREKKK